MSIRSYSDRGFESDYKEMYKHLGKSKDFRECVYIKYLSDKKKLALRRIGEIENLNKSDIGNRRRWAKNRGYIYRYTWN